MASEKKAPTPDLAVSPIVSANPAPPSWTAEEEAEVRRKLDYQIVPTVSILYLLCFLDRANIGNARIEGMGAELGLNAGYRFNYALSIFFVAYLLVEVPSNVLLKRFGPRFFIPGLVIGFGFISFCTAFVHTFGQLLVLRALLGVFEGGAMPGIAFFLSSFYKRSELYFRVAIYIASAAMAGGFGGLLAAALSKMPTWGASSMPIHTWRNIFFFEGLVTMALGVAATFLLPQRPGQARYLTERERWIAEERLVVEHGDGAAKRVQLHHVRRALGNINNYVCGLCFFMINVTVQGMAVFLPTILADLGWHHTKAQLYSVPPYVLASVATLAVAYISDRTRMRGLYLALLTLLGIVGFAVLRWSESSSAKYTAVYLCAVASFPGGAGFLSWGINNAGGAAVRAVSGAYIVTLGTFGGIVATWTYVAKDGPRYRVGHSLNLAAQIGCLFLTSAGILYCVRENRLRARGGRDDRLQGLTDEQKEDLGYRHPAFRYIP